MAAVTNSDGMLTRSSVRRSAGTPEETQVKLFSFFEELAEPVRKLVQTAWRSRGKLAHDVKAYVLLFASMVCSMPSRALRVVQNPKLHTLLAEEEDPQALAAVLAGSGGALCLGSVGAVIGATVGSATGLCFGAIPALFTFGLSLPVAAVLGGLGGILCGALTGSSAGFVGGASSGMFFAYFRIEIRSAAVYVSAKLYDVYDLFVARPTNAVKAANRKVRDGVRHSAVYTKDKVNWWSTRRMGSGVLSSMVHPYRELVVYEEAHLQITGLRDAQDVPEPEDFDEQSLFVPEEREAVRIFVRIFVRHQVALGKFTACL